MKKTLLVSSAMAVVLLCAPAFAELPSTPAEKAQTQALNVSAASGTYASPQVLNGGQFAQRSQDVQDSEEADARTNFDPNDFVALKTVDPDRLDGATVEDASGAVIGRVSDVVLAGDGTPAEVAIELNDGGDVRVSEAALRYNPTERILLTNLDIGELKSAGRNGE